MKRTFDIVFATAGLILLSPLLLLVSMFIKLDSRGPVFFKQVRIGKRFQPFTIYKFRTMVDDATQPRKSITIGQDSRITRVGCLLRQTKIDELPQLVNVIKGNMSLVGPRPEIPQYVQLFRKDYERILTVRPGMTDLASVKYQDEAQLLGGSANPEEEYLRRVLPDKIRLAKDYVDRASFLLDLQLIFRTIPKLFGTRAIERQSMRRIIR